MGKKVLKVCNMKKEERGKTSSLKSVQHKKKKNEEKGSLKRVQYETARSKKSSLKSMQYDKRHRLIPGVPQYDNCIKMHATSELNTTLLEKGEETARKWGNRKEKGCRGERE